MLVFHMYFKKAGDSRHYPILNNEMFNRLIGTYYADPLLRYSMVDLHTYFVGHPSPKTCSVRDFKCFHRPTCPDVRVNDGDITLGYYYTDMDGRMLLPNEVPQGEIAFLTKGVFPIEVDVFFSVIPH